MNVKTYDYDDLRSTDYRNDDTYKFEFIADIAGDNADLFDGLDNHEVNVKLKKKGVLSKEDCDDVESCCYYVYFKTKEAGMSFIDKLNGYIAEKAQLIRAAAAF